MRRPVNRGTEGIVETVPAPVGGLNTRDPIADMAPEDAIILDNFFTTPSDVMLRKGTDNHVTGIGAQVQSLMVYNRSTASAMFAAAGTAFYNVTTAGAVGAAVQSSLTNAKWYHVNFATTAAQYLIACNGADKPRYWDNSAWVAVDNASTPAITGVTTTTLIYPAVFKNRVWFVQKDTLTSWYLPADAVGGAATAFRLNGVAKKGGYLVAMGTWTLDAGEGADDHLVFITSEGEVIVYRGTDPSSTTTWQLAGVWDIPRPIGRRCLIKYAGDLLILTVSGVYPMSKALIASQVDPRAAITDKISPTIRDAARSFSANFGWEVMHYPSADMLLLNVPVSEGNGQQQYVMNTVSGGWSRFTGWNANCWALLSGEPYFGGNGVVVKVWSTYDDEGVNINGQAKTAFNYTKRKNQKKQWMMAQTVISSNGEPTHLLALDVDFSDVEPTASVTYSGSSSGVWDASLWDSGTWGSGSSVLKQWQAVSGVGMCAATRMKIASRGIEVRWSSTNWLYKPAGIGP